MNWLQMLTFSSSHNYLDIGHSPKGNAHLYLYDKGVLHMHKADGRKHGQMWPYNNHDISGRIDHDKKLISTSASIFDLPFVKEQKDYVKKILAKKYPDYEQVEFD